jgi:peptide/nickel transport system substrate-binding protein
VACWQPAGAPAPARARPHRAARPAPKKGGTLVFGVDAEEKGFSPTQGTFDEVGIMYARTVFDTLMILDDTGVPQPNLAESVSSDSAGTVWTIKCRSNIKFHNGAVCDAAAIAANFNAHIKSLLTGPALTPVQSVVVTDPTTITITMKTPWVPFSYYLCGGIGSQFAFIAEPTWLATSSQTNPVGTGPFVFQEWVPNSHFTATRNPNYWRAGLPHLDTITYKAIPDAQQLLASLNSGAVDMLHTSNATDTAAMRSNKTLGYIDDSKNVAGEPDMGCLLLNLRKAPFDNLKLRQAMAYATSSEQYVQVIDQGVTETSNGVFVKGSPYYLADNGYPAYNLAKAKQLVSEVKAAGGSVTFNLGHTPDPKGAQIGQYLQQVLQQAGMVITLQPILQDSIINVALTGGFQALTWRQFGAVNPDLNYIFWTPTNALTPGFAINMTGNADPAMQTALLQGRSSTDKAGQMAAYQTVNKLLSQDIPYIWYSRVVWSIGAQPKVQNFNNPSTPSGGKAYGQIGGAIWPQQIWLS